MITRKQWGAKPAARVKVDPARRTGVVIHHTVTSTGASQDQVEAILRRIDAQHRSQGWAGIGYNLCVDYAGRIYEGRGLDYKGAHTENNNTANYGIAYIGDGRKRLPAAALHGLRSAVRRCEVHSRRNLPVRGHRDFKPTECPGRRIYRHIKAGELV